MKLSKLIISARAARSTAAVWGGWFSQARCSALIALWLIRVEEPGLGVDLVSLPAVDFGEAGGSGFAETFEVVPNHTGTSQRVQKFF